MTYPTLRVTIEVGHASLCRNPLTAVGRLFDLLLEGFQPLWHTIDPHAIAIHRERQGEKTTGELHDTLQMSWINPFRCTLFRFGG